MMRVLAAEFLKLKRARMLLWAALTVFGYAAISSTMLPALKDPEMVKRIGEAGGAFAKAAAAGYYDMTWENYLRSAPQGIAGSWGVLLFGVVTAYLFGREYSEGTAKNMLTLPVRRESFVLAKTAVLALWVLALTLLSVAVTLGFGVFLELSGFAWAHVWTCLIDCLKVSLLLYLTLPLVAWFAMLGKGYLPPMLFTVAMMAVGNVLVVRDWANLFPWSMSVVLAGASWMPVPPAELVPGSWAVAAAVVLAGLVLDLHYVDHADNAQ